MAGIQLMANEQGVAIMNSLADAVDEGSDSIVEQTDRLLEDVEQYRALGPHKNSIKSIIVRIQEETKNSSAPARVVAEKLRQKAREYQEWIDDDLFGSGSGN